MYDNIKWYHQAIDQDQQNWGFFSFVPHDTVRVSFATWNEKEAKFEEFDEYKLTEPPYVGRHNMFNFVRGLADYDDRYNEIRNRYLQWYCQKEGIADQTIYLRKKYAALPQEELMQYYDWNTYKPEWKYKPITEVHCPPL